MSIVPLKIERDEEHLETLIVDGRLIAYQDVGCGPTIILAHCSGASHRVWAPFVDAFRGRYRVIAPDLVGYGHSEKWPINARLHPWSDLSALVALAERSSAPVHLVGHSYGGTVALEAARVLGARVKSVTLIEPIAFHLLRLTGRMQEWQELSDVGREMMEALRLRREHGAAGVYMKYWVGRLRWWSMSPKARRRVLLTVGKVGAEFELVSGLSTTAGDYRTLNAPTRLVVGERTRKPARAIVDELLDLLPDSHLKVIANAGHMSPLTHAHSVATLVSQHVEQVEASLGRMKPTTWQAAQARPKRRSIA
ncbi:MAG TPA: alpha/beta hydrolase [Gemmatimonadaceae bacterium]|nr:alpha/beta hydrolase [Gemmatimonadaceae bacterium]